MEPDGFGESFARAGLGTASGQLHVVCSQGLAFGWSQLLGGFTPGTKQVRNTPTAIKMASALIILFRFHAATFPFMRLDRDHHESARLWVTLIGIGYGRRGEHK
jgi:hypothetical protein